MRFRFFTVEDGGATCGAALLAGSRVACVSAMSAYAARVLGDSLTGSLPKLEVVVGVRDAVSGFWRGAFGDESPRRVTPQQLFELETAPEPFGDWHVERATRADAEQIVAASREMAEADAGRPLARRDVHGFESTVVRKIDSGRVWCARDPQGDVVFKVSLALSAPACAQLEGVWVRPDLRGGGVATGALSRVCRALLQDFGRLSLYADRANASASRLYRRLGFVATVSYETRFREAPPADGTAPSGDASSRASCAKRSR